MTDGNKMVENKKIEYVPFQHTAILTSFFQNLSYPYGRFQLPRYKQYMHMELCAV